MACLPCDDSFGTCFDLLANSLYTEEIGGSAGGNSLPVEAGQQRDHSPRSLDLHEEYTYAYLGQIRRVELTGISSGSVGSHHQKDEKQAFAMDARDELAQRLSQLQRLKKKRVEDFMKKPPPRTAADQKAFEQLLKDVKPIKPKRSTQQPAGGVVAERSPTATDKNPAKKTETKNGVSDAGLNVETRLCRAFRRLTIMG
eukprot:m.408166 g.408166  ORF g.408166 m.408166 type:complete len:199 (-) comp21231_c2_seq50:673-1269(-)